MIFPHKKKEGGARKWGLLTAVPLHWVKVLVEVSLPFMMKKEATKYELEPRDVNDFKEKVKDILLYCQIHKIPMFLSIATKSAEESTEYMNIVYSAAAHNINLADDKIAKYILVANGFEAVPPRDAINLSEDGFDDILHLDDCEVEKSE